MAITYLKGDATLPVGDDPKMIIHVCNNIGAWGSGFVVPLGRRYPLAETSYRLWAKGGLGYPPFKLGEVQFVPVRHTLTIANMVAQNGTASRNNPQPIVYDALGECLAKVRDMSLDLGASVHGPRFGAGLAGGKWSMIESLITHLLDGVSVTIYDL